MGDAGLANGGGSGCGGWCGCLRHCAAGFNFAKESRDVRLLSRTGVFSGILFLCILEVGGLVKKLLAGISG